MTPQGAPRGSRSNSDRSRSAGPGAAEVAPPRPGTLAPGTDGMTDAATANGDDRDPEIELFVKVGRRPGAASPAAPPARLAAHVPRRPESWDARPSPGSASQPWRSPGWPLCKPELCCGAPGRDGVRCNLAGGYLLRESAGSLSNPLQDPRSPCPGAILACPARQLQV